MLGGDTYWSCYWYFRGPCHNPLTQSTKTPICRRPAGPPIQPQLRYLASNECYIVGVVVLVAAPISGLRAWQIASASAGSGQTGRKQTQHNKHCCKPICEEGITALPHRWHTAACAPSPRRAAPSGNLHRRPFTNGGRSAPSTLHLPRSTFARSIIYPDLFIAHSLTLWACRGQTLVGVPRLTHGRRSAGRSRRFPTRRI